METKDFTKNWLSLGNLDSKKIFLKDYIIPECKQDNIDVSFSGYWIKLKHEWYYFKAREKEFLLRELLGEKVSNFFHLPTVHYELAKGTVGKEEIYGVLSKYARDKSKKYVTLQDYLFCYGGPFSGVEMVDFISEIHPDAPIREEVYAFLVRDFFTNDWDRVANEILIEFGDSHHLGYLCDYEYEFTDVKSQIAIPELYYISLENEIILEKIRKDELFKKYFEQALQINLIGMLEQLCQEKKIRLDSYVYDEIQIFEQKQKEYIARKLSF